MWGESWNGGPAHKGICPVCGEHNGSTWDGECDEHLPVMEPEIMCPECEKVIEPADMTTAGVCQECYQMQLTEYFNYQIIN